VKKTVFIEMDYYEFEELVEKHFGRNDYEFVADVECGNDSSHTFNIKKEPLDTWGRKEFDEWKLTGKGRYLASHILTELVNMGILDEGEYLINVSW
jgi:hypothetical protein